MRRERTLWMGLGLGLATGSTIVLEIALTRIFSVVLWYHYGFMTISLAMLGLGLAGIYVYLYAERFPREHAGRDAARAALLFAASAVGALLALHWIVSVRTHWPLGAGFRSLLFLVAGTPFFFAGLTVAIPITRFPERVGVLYAADLIGAALGAAAVVPLIGLLGGPPVLLVCAALAALAAVCFAAGAAATRRVAAGLAGALACLVGLGLALESDFFRIRYAKNTDESNVIAERWNSFSRVAVYEPRILKRSFGWTLGRGAPQRVGGHRWIRIDGGAATPMIAFDGRLDEVRYLAYDITSLGYQLRDPHSALVIGSGGGRDILTAKLFGVERVHAVEVNPIIVDFVRREFRDYSGSPYDLPGVSFSVRDGRSYVAESREHFDLIQISAVDTTAALAAGALALVENTLYTVEAFEDYHDRLSEDGILSITRNWTRESQMMAIRSADLVRAAWERRGHEQPERHLAIVAPKFGTQTQWYTQWGTLLASRRPFDARDVEQLEALTESLGFSILYRPDVRTNPPALQEIFGDGREALLREYPYDVRASTDDKPFFFFFTKLLPSAREGSRFRSEQDLRWASKSTPGLLLQAFVLVTVLVALFAFAIPLWAGRLRPGAARGAARQLAYFAAIGLGFILVEISLIQRYTLLLGQPVYAFAAILGCILVFSGIGSLLSQAVADDRVARAARLATAAVGGLSVLHALALPGLLHGAMRLELPWRVAVSVATIAPLGLLMGVPLPLGMRWTQRRAPQALAWAWGVNGSLSVLGTVLAMVVSIFFGIRYTLIAGAVLYALACAALGGRAAAVGASAPTAKRQVARL